MSEPRIRRGFSGQQIEEATTPVPEGQVRVYAIHGYIDEDELWVGALEEAGDYEWWLTNRQTRVVDVPVEALRRYEAAHREWRTAHDELVQLCGWVPENFR